MARQSVHAACVAVGGAGVLLRGPSGSGKSDLALRLIEAGAFLVSDDLTELRLRDGGQLEGRFPAHAPQALFGLLEVRGLGLLKVPSVAAAPLRLVVDLDAAIERLPEPACCTYLGMDVPLIRIDAFAASAAAKVRLATRLVPAAMMPR